MGIVYLARELAAEREVAMKFLQRPGNQAAFERFLVEVRALALLDHPHIIGVFSSDFFRADPFFTSEFVPGGSLSRKVETDGPFDPLAAARLMALAARAVHAANAANVIHRDVKPSNVLLAEDGTPRIADFGLAKRLDRDDGLTTGPGPLGTPRYMAPEQTSRAEGEIDARTDVYGLGATLYFVLTGQPPFTGNHEESLRQIQHDLPAPPRSIRKTIPRELEAIVLKCLEKNPASRYPTAEALAEDLDRFLAGQAPDAPLLTWPRRVARRLRRYRPSAALATLALLPVLALGAIFWPKTPVDPAEEIRRALKAGKSYTILGETGLPKYYRWRLGAGQFGVSTTGEKACYYESIGHSMLEVVPDDPGIDSYRLTLSLRHIDKAGAADPAAPLPDFSYLGPYFGDAEQLGANGAPVHTFFGLPYCDIERNGGNSNGSFHQLRFLSGCFALRDKDRPPLFKSQIAYSNFAGSDNPPGEWRTFRIDISPHRIRIEWKPENASEFVLVKELSETALQPQYARVEAETIRGWPAPGITVPSWSPRLAAGIWSHRAAVSIKNIVIQPFQPRS